MLADLPDQFGPPDTAPPLLNRLMEAIETKGTKLWYRHEYGTRRQFTLVVGGGEGRGGLDGLGGPAVDGRLV